MKQTATEWLIDQMLKQGYFDGNKPLSITNLDHLQHQAKEMERSQMIEFAERLPLKSGLLQEGGTYCERGNVEEYYNKVYGIGAVSEGSDATSSQTEISDEKILDAAREAVYEDIEVSVGSFELGARWYREQLKSKQC